MSPRHFITVLDLSKAEFDRVLNEAAVWKRNPLGTCARRQDRWPSCSANPRRARGCRSAWACTNWAGCRSYMAEQEMQIRKSESIEDTARVLSRYVDAIVIRTFLHQDVVDLAAASSVPVINALTDDDHPCQALADVMTLQERFGDLKGRKITYLGDGNNVAASLAEACTLAGMDVCLSVPEGYDLPPDKMRTIEALASKHNTEFWIERDPAEAAKRLRPCTQMSG